MKIRKLMPKRGWKLLGGEPPGGTNNIPIIEIKDPQSLNKGSRGSKKIDLIFYKSGIFLLVEAKPKFSRSDEEKLDEIVGSENLREGFVRALEEKHIFGTLENRSNKENYISNSELYIKALALGKTPESVKSDFVVFVLEDSEFSIVFGKHINRQIKDMFGAWNDS